MASGVISKYADGTDTGWQEITNADAFTGTIYARKIGKIVTLYATNLRLLTDLTSAYRSLGGTLLANYAPGQVLSIFAGSLDKIGQVRISNNGATNFFKSTSGTWTGGSSGDTISFVATYMTA